MKLGSVRGAMKMKQRGRACIASAPGEDLSRLRVTTYQQQGSMPVQHAAPATQQEPANAVAENAVVLKAATILMNIDFIETLQLLNADGEIGRKIGFQSGGFHGRAGTSSTRDAGISRRDSSLPST